MQPYQQRVVDEKAELDGRREKLHAFMTSSAFDELTDGEQMRMAKQCRLMRELSDVLGDRIKNFTE